MGVRCRVPPTSGTCPPVSVPKRINVGGPRRPDPGQDVWIDALITRTSIRNLLLQGAFRRDAMST